MKKLIGCPAGEWARRLFTVERFAQLAYFVDDEDSEFYAFDDGGKAYGGVNMCSRTISWTRKIKTILLF